MAVIMLTLTVFFDDPFWAALLEREEGGRYCACKIVFGAEPKDYEVFDFLLKNQLQLRFGPTQPSPGKTGLHGNPKRMQRAVSREMQKNVVGTKAQQALKLMQEQGKAARHTASRERREAEMQKRFVLRQQKRKEKHRGH